MAVPSATVIQYYTGVLRLQPTAQQVTYLSNAADEATLLNILETEALTQVNPIIRLYQGAFNRVPDSAGLTNIVGKYVNGPVGTTAVWTLTQISQNFCASPEFIATYGSSSPVATTTGATAYISALYNNILGRVPVTSEVTFWQNWTTQQLAAGNSAATVTAQLLTMFTESPEFIRNSAPYIQNFQSASAQGTETYTGTLWAQGIGEAYTLTTNIDNFVATGVNSVFNSSNTVGSITLNPLDSIKGTAGNDTFNISDNTGTLLASLPAVTVQNVETVNIATTGVVGNTTQAADFSGWTGLTALNVNASTGTDNIKAAATTNVKVVNSAGAVTVAGGLAQTITTTAGAVTSTGAAGAVTVTDTAVGSVGTTAESSTVTDVVNVASGTNVNVTATALTTAGTGTTGTVTVGSSTSAVTGTVNVTTQVAAANGKTQGAVTVNGGTVVTVNETTGNAVNTTNTQGAVTVNGGAATTSVTINQAAAATASETVVGVANGTDKIVDAQYAATTTTGKNGLGTITTVSLSGVSGTSNEIDASNLQNLTVNNSTASTTVAIKQGALATGVTAAETLTLNLNNNAGLTVSDQNKYKTLNVVTGATGSTLTVVGTTTASAITSLNLSGSSVLSLTAATSTTGMLNLQSIVVSGAAGLTDSDLASISTLTSINASGTSGKNTVTIANATAAYQGGSGNDTVTIAANTATSKTITGGNGSDTIVLTGAAASYAAAGASLISGFETVQLNDGTTQTWDFSGANGTGSSQINGVTAVTINSTGAETIIARTGTALNIIASAGATTFKSYDLTGATDSLHVNIGTAATSALTVTSLTATDYASTAVGINSLTITSTSADAGNTNTITNLIDNGLHNLTFDGANKAAITTLTDSAATLAVTNSGSALASIGSFNNGSANTGSFTSLTLSNTGTGSLAIAGTTAQTLDALATLTLTDGVAIGTAGAVGAAGTGGIKATSSGVALTVNGASNNSSVVLDESLNTSVITVTLGNGTNTVKGGTAADVITVGTGSNFVQGNAGADKVTFGTHTSTSSAYDTVKIAAATDTGANTADAVQTSVLTSAFDVYTGLAAGDKIVLTDVATSATNKAIATNLAAVDDYTVFARGTYNAASGTFTYSATGADTLMTYDTAAETAVAAKSIVLVGIVETAPGMTGGIVTL